MIWISPGSFTMGSPISEPGRSDDEVGHLVSLTKGYWLGRTEVTQGQWQTVMGNNPSSFKSVGLDAPVETVSWGDVQAFCLKLTESERIAGRLPQYYEYTLPTEAQWEYACRAGTAGEFASGLDAMGWYGKNSASTTHLVGQKPADAWGLADMHGNVWEWCADWYGPYPDGKLVDPKGPSSGPSRVLRGGSWGDEAVNCRSARRGGNVPDYRGGSLGFRLALAPSS